MGKTLSKRSVDITTEGKKCGDDQFAEKVEKIEDVDQKDVNGDTTIEEKSDLEKKTANETGEDEDMANEKAVDSLAIGDNEEQNKPSPVVETAKDDGATVAEAEEISPLADESIKKSKKEKVKKKWSFRNISFGKKDKQKPTKNDDAAENTTATNGNFDEKVTPTKEVQVPQSEETVNLVEDDSSEQTAEKSNTTQTAINEVNEPKANEKLTEKIKETTVVSTASENDSASDSQENTKIVDAVNMEISTINVKHETISSSNCYNETTSKSTVNGSGEVTLVTETKYQCTTVEAENNKSIPNNLTNEITNTILNGENPQHNGTNSESEFEIEQSKAEIEVNTNSDNVSNVTINCPAPPTNPIPFNEQLQLQLQDSHNVNSEKNKIVDQNEEPSQIIAERVKDEISSFELSLPPLPESAPPSQVAAFALTVNATELNEEVSAINVTLEDSDTAKDNIVHSAGYQQIENDFKNTNLDENVLNDLNAANDTRQVECNIPESTCFNNTEAINEHLESYSDKKNVGTIDFCSRNINLSNNLQTSESTTPEEVAADKRIDEVQQSVNSTQQLVENSIEQFTIASDVKNLKHENISMGVMNNIDIVEVSHVKSKENINTGFVEANDQIIFETDTCDTSDVNVNRVNESFSSSLSITKNVNNEGFELSNVLPSDLDNEKKNDVLSQAVIQDAESNLNSKDFAKVEELKEKVAANTTDGIKQDIPITCE